MKKLFTALFSLLALLTSAQTNIISTNPLAETIMKGNYNPSLYSNANVLSADSMVSFINASVSADSLKSYIIKLAAFRNRNSGSDTLSAQTGIGAARRWVYEKFQNMNSRLIPSYLQFDVSSTQMCGMISHRNIFSVLPGTDTSDKSIVIIEGHMDSRCAGLCDTACVAEGVEDNASGTALVIELARVMSQLEFKRTIVFLVTTGEEQGLYGAEAFADYVQLKGIHVRAVQNNDVIGGIICGKTSSAPSCPGLNDIDSTQVRLFSFGSFNSKSKALARYIKLQYKEELLPFVTVPMRLTVMTAEDRTGRGGDHIPFREHGYPAMRFTSANEHGDASNSTGYTDRQHTTEDILGVDTDGDAVIDSFFVDFNYLGRNAVINGASAAMIARGPANIDFSAMDLGARKVLITIDTPVNSPSYRVAIRTNSHDWDSVFTIYNRIDTITVLTSALHYISVAAVDSEGVESLFSKEVTLNLTSAPSLMAEKPYQLLGNRPNPFDEATTISVMVSKPSKVKEAYIIITDSKGALVSKLPLSLQEGINDVVFEHGYGAAGVYNYSLVIDGAVQSTRKMIFTP